LLDFGVIAAADLRNAGSATTELALEIKPRAWGLPRLNGRAHLGRKRNHRGRERKAGDIHLLEFICRATSTHG
jgi:hypothetical protein